MAKFFEDGMILKDIAKIFRCSHNTIRKTLINFLEKERYKKIAREHSRENQETIGRKLGKLPKKSKTKKQIETSRENIKKAHLLPRTPTQIENSRENGRKTGRENLKKAHEALAKGVWISNPEHRFFLICLSKMFFLKDIEKQYYLKGLNHAFDFAIPSQKLLFEIDGDYWHSQNPKRDVEIDNFAKSAGWSIFRFNDAKLKELRII